MTRTRRALAALAAPVFVLGLSACSTDEIGAAAVVGDERITVTELQDEVRAYTATLPDSPDATGDVASLQQTILQRMVHHELFAALAEREGIDVTEAQIDNFLDQLTAQQGGDLAPFLAQSGFTEESVRTAVYDELVRQQLSQQLGGEEAMARAVEQLAEEMGVTINPRYGEWSGLGIEPVSGSISEPAGAEQG